MCYYSGNRLIHPQLMQPTAYYIQIAWHGIFLILSHALIFANGWFTVRDGFYGTSACWLSRMKQ